MVHESRQGIVPSHNLKDSKIMNAIINFPAIETETKTVSPVDREREARKVREANLHRDENETIFVAGRTYWTRSIGDSECIHKAKVISRTPKSLRVEIRGEVVTRRVNVCEGSEEFSPFGKYSFSPVLSSKKFLS
jgi:hypothetical protein